MLTYSGYRDGHFSSPQHSPWGRSHQTGYTPYLPNSSLHRSAYSHLHKFLVYTLQHTWSYIYKAVTPASIVSKFSILHTQVYTFTNTINKDKIQSRNEELCFYFGHIVSLAIQWYSPADMHHWTANSSCPQNEAVVYIASYRTDHK